MPDSAPNSGSLSWDHDPQAQLDEIELLLEAVFTRRDALHGEISECDHDLERYPVGSIEHHLAHDGGNSLRWRACYREAACSHAAVGALAPFIEGLLVRFFICLRKRDESAQDRAVHHRGKLASDAFWDPHKASEKGKLCPKDDLMRGTRQLVEALALSESLPHATLSTIDAMLVYRNRALHCGYEWPIEDRRKFVDTVHEKGWGEWFTWESIDGDPWIISMQDRFIRENCLAAARKLLAEYQRRIRY